MKTSEEVKRFLDFMHRCETRYGMAKEGQLAEEKRLQDYLHAIEFEPHAEERSKTATKLRQSRIRRRENKDVVEELGPIIEFLEDPNMKRAIDRLGQTLGKIRKAEKYHENRVYHPRVEKEGKDERGNERKTGRRRPGQVAE